MKYRDEFYRALVPREVVGQLPMAYFERRFGERWMCAGKTFFIYHERGEDGYVCIEARTGGAIAYARSVADCKRLAAVVISEKADVWEATMAEKIAKYGMSPLYREETK